MRKPCLLVYSLWAVPYALFYALTPLGGLDNSTGVFFLYCSVWLFSIVQLWKGKKWAYVFSLITCGLAFFMGSVSLTAVYQYFYGTYTGRPEFVGIAIMIFIIFGLPAAISLVLLTCARKSILKSEPSGPANLDMPGG